MLSNKVITDVGPQMLADDTIHFKFDGSAGQSFRMLAGQGYYLGSRGRRQ